MILWDKRNDKKMEVELSSGKCLSLAEGGAEFFQFSKSEVKYFSAAVILIAMGTRALLFISLILLDCLLKAASGRKH